MLRFRSLGSGSSGNATLVEAGDGHGALTRVLVDCGFGLKQLDARLGRIGLMASQLDAVFITHEHGDHVGCAHALSQRDGTAVWMSEGTWLAIAAPDFAGRLQLARDGVSFGIGALQIEPFTVPHDAREPLQLVCGDGARRLGILTDLGHATPYVLARLQGLGALLLEFNHDIEMLAESSYPPFLKQRVGGNYGHLSNQAAAAIASVICHVGLRHVIAAHLSRQNNRPELVRTALSAALSCRTEEVTLADAASGSVWMDL